MIYSSIAFNYLSKFVGDHSLLTSADIHPLYRLQQDAKFVSSQIPRLILVGEFKAGKSSLMNALLRGEHAATDVLEMTSWVARYWPSDSPFCRIMQADGKEIEVQPENFKQKCQSRDFTQNELSQIFRVDIGLPVPSMTFSIIDCPGLGSVARENERRMVDALQDADVIVWAVDVDSIGGMREGALLQKLLSQGMPYIAVLTKCDLISDPEIDEIKHYICDEFSIEQQNIFSTSARKALEEIKLGKEISIDTGIPQLDNFIRHDVSTRHSELRKQAELAHDARINAQALILVDRVHSELLIAKNALGSFKNIAENMCKAVQGQLEMEIESMVRERMFENNRSAILYDIETSLRSGCGSFSQDAIADIFKKNLGEHYLDLFWQEISTTMATSATHLWMDKLKDAQVELEKICLKFQSESWKEFTDEQTSQGMSLNTDTIKNETLSTALKTSFGIAGVATVCTAATAHFSLLAAATGVGIPIAVIGAGVSYALASYQKDKLEKNAALEATVFVDTYIKHFIEEILRPRLFPQIAELNLSIEKQMVAGFEHNLKANLPDESLEVMLNEASKIKYELEAFLRNEKPSYNMSAIKAEDVVDDIVAPVAEENDHQAEIIARTTIESDSCNLLATLNQIADDPSIPEVKKIKLIIHATSLICAILAAQPLPFADIFILTPIQVVMVTAMARVMGNPIGKEDPKEIVASVTAVVGWGVLAQQLILGGYKTIIPFMGAVTTIPLVYAATFGLGYAAHAVLEARRRDQTVSKEEIQRIKEEAEKQTKQEKRDWSIDGLRREYDDLKHKAKEFEQYKEMLQQTELDRQRLQREKEELLKKYAGAVTAEELDEILKENYSIRAELDHIKPEFEKLIKKTETVSSKRADILKKRFGHCYPSICLEAQAWRDIVELVGHRLNAFERQMGLMQHDISKARFRDIVIGTRIRELDFDHDGRIYASIEGNSITIWRIGDKRSQDSDIKWIKSNCPKG